MKKTIESAPSQPIIKNKLYLGIFFLFIAVIALILIFVLPDKKTNNESNEQYTFTKEGTAYISSQEGIVKCRFDIEIADTPERLSTGLMYRDSMSVNQAMLFVFDKSEQRSFWMKNTYLPLDIVYISKDSTIVSVSENTTPFSEQTVMSKGPALYVLEINAGLYKQYGLETGDKFYWQRD